ncbi:MAG: hypothetical protein IK020_12880 [Clostridiales bacterium]|nr:hypothetical protein [Clostridiales bacterium]
MKKLAKLLMVTLLILSLPVPVTACRNSKETEGSSRKRKDPDHSEESTLHTLDTDSYDLVVPTGTLVESDEPDLPEDIVYWDPTRALKDEYTMDEALQRYAIVVGHSTLIYNECDELQMRHDFNCADYGKKLFLNNNEAYFITEDGESIDGLVTYADLRDPCFSSLPEFTENLGWLYVGNMGYYSPEDPDAPEITIVEQDDDHVFATVKKTPPYSDEGLFYATVISGNVFYTEYKNNYSDEELTDQDRQAFARYSALLFEHLIPDDGTEPYLYDKLVNTPILGGKKITGFDHITYISGRSIGIETRKDTPIQYCTIVIGAEDRYLERSTGSSDWIESNGMQMREYTEYPYHQQFVFTMDGIRYFINAQNRDSKKFEVDSLDDLLKLIEECCYMK